MDARYRNAAAVAVASAVEDLAGNACVMTVLPFGEDTLRPDVAPVDKAVMEAFCSALVALIQA